MGCQALARSIADFSVVSAATLEAYDNYFVFSGHFAHGCHQRPPVVVLALHM